MSETDVLIIGGGISGLSVAWWLAQDGLSVEVWEQADRLGGKIATDRQSGYQTERAATMVLNLGSEIGSFLQASGLGTHRLTRPESGERYLVDDGRLTALPTKIGAMVNSSLWSLSGKMRMLREPLVPKGGHDNETVTEFVRRRLGPEVLEKALEPYVAGPLASDPDLANARSVLPRLTTLERKYGSLTFGILARRLLGRRAAVGAEAFSFPDGMATLVDTLAGLPAINLRTRHAALELQPGKRFWTIQGHSPQGDFKRTAKQVVLCTPAAGAAGLVGQLDGELEKLLRGIDYAHVSVIHTGFARAAIGHDLNGSGFLVPRREQRDPTGCLWMSSLFPGRAPEDKVLLSSYLGGARQPAAVNWDDDQSLQLLMDALRPLLAIREEPEMVRIDRHRNALPLYHGAYPARMKAIDASLSRLPGLHLAANYRGGVSVRDRIAQGYSTARQIRCVLDQQRSTAATRVSGHQGHDGINIGLGTGVP